MSRKRSHRTGEGTFAKLYDVQEELNQRHQKPLGRPRKKVRRKPTTVHLTQPEIRSLSQLHLLINEQFSINRSELVGIAVDTLNLLIEEKGEMIADEGEFRDIDTFREAVFDFIKSKNQKIKKSKTG